MGWKREGPRSLDFGPPGYWASLKDLQSAGPLFWVDHGLALGLNFGFKPSKITSNNNKKTTIKYEMIAKYEIIIRHKLINSKCKLN